jgi:hypothetical protein
VVEVVADADRPLRAAQITAGAAEHEPGAGGGAAVAVRGFAGSQSPAGTN